MEKRLLGRTDLQVAPLAFGGNVFGWTVDRPTAFQLLDHFAASGYNLIDTADVYSNWVSDENAGSSERIIGEWMKERNNRNSMTIATKVGSSMNRGDKKTLKKEYILKAAEDSLKRLQTDYIDLYQTHYDDPDTGLEETLSAYATLVEQGKVRWIGTSNFTRQRLKESLEVSDRFAYPRYETLQPHYNLYHRKEFETQLRDICLKETISVIPYYSLASGFLTGKYRSEEDFSKSARGGGIKRYMNERGFTILNALDEVAAYNNTQPAVVALAWLMAQPAIAAPIASATSIDQLSQLLQAGDLELNKETIDMLNKASEE